MDESGFNMHRLLVHKEILPCGPAFGYYPDRKEIVRLDITGYLAETIEFPTEKEIQAKWDAFWGTFDDKIKAPPPEKPPEQGRTFGQKTLAYRCGQYFIGDDFKFFGHWPVENVFATKEEAEKQTKFTEVDLPFEVYYKALGIDNKGERLQEYEDKDGTNINECDLPSCCANISAVRDRLAECMLHKGLEQWKIDIVKDYLESSHPEMLVDAGNDLSKILKALGVLKKKDKKKK